MSYTFRICVGLLLGFSLITPGAVHAVADDATKATESAAAKTEDKSDKKEAEKKAEAKSDEKKSDKKKEDDGWISLFNGKDLKGWKISENPKTFSVKDKILIVKGPRAHMFYNGDVNKGEFKNFEWKCEIMTKKNANSGMYFHTKYQKEGWPEKGYEVQVNNTHPDPKKTGGLYAVADIIDKSPAKDNEWFTQHVIVKGKRIIVKVNGKVVTDYIEPDNPDRGGRHQGKLLGKGTIAIQGHDPGSEIHYRKILIKPLPDDEKEEKTKSDKDA